MNESNSNGIAIIGIAGRFPGAASVDEFWRNLVTGKESISTFSDEELAASGLDVAALRKDPNYVAARGILEEAELFDAAFFDINAKQAEIIDPQQRLFLEASWSALEQAGYDPESFQGAVGVYAGMANETYFINNLHSRRDLIDLVGERIVNLGNAKDFLALRVAYKLNLRGPALSINTACSTGLVVVCQACQSLLSYQCDLALAGGVAASFPQRRGVRYQENGIFSPDGHCRPLDINAQGTVSSEGLGIVVLKRLAEALEDGDNIVAVIKGFGLNNDGSNKVGFTAPSVEGQAEAIAIAQADAGFDPSTISYVECHGTATPIGDPIEIAALTQAFRLHTNEKNFCAIGSVKGNIGHTDTAAGVAGLIKTALALKHKTLPASLNFEKPNPKIDFGNSPFFVNTKLTEWKAGPTPRRAGVSSFGLGGTNAHVVLEEAPALAPSSPSRPWQLLLLSAKTAPALAAASANLLTHLKAHPELNLADAAFTLQAGRAAFQHRRMVVCRDVADAVKALETADSKRLVTQQATSKGRPVVFMFSGQGAQYVNMGAELYRTEAVFQEEVDRCAKILLPHLGQDLRQVLFPAAEQQAAAEEQLLQTRITQPALFVFEYALTRLWQSWGVVPAAMIGHSVGSIVAACVAGVFSLEDALAFVARRSQLVQEQPKGAMLAVRLPEQEVLPLLSAELSIAAINSPSLCVVSGPFGAIEELEGRLKEQGVAARRLHTSHAFHSAMMDPVLAPLAEFLAGIKFQKLTIPFISDVTGRWITEPEATDPKYWVRHVRQAVRFADGVGELLKHAEYILLEVGPGQTLSPLASQHPAKVAGHVVLSSFSATKEQEMAALLNAVGRLWLAGQVIDWAAFYKGEKRRRIPLPTYAFQRERYWVEGRRTKAIEPSSLPDSGKKPDMADWFYDQSWKRSAPWHLAQPPSQPQNWLLFLDDGGLGETLAKNLTWQRDYVTRVVLGTGYEKISDDTFAVNPRRLEDYELLISELVALNRVPQRIVHLWGLCDSRGAADEWMRLEWAQDLGLHSLIFLARSLGEKNITAGIDMEIVSNNVQAVTGDEIICPEKATVLGACKVIPLEYPNIGCRSVDIIIPKAGSTGERRLIAQLLSEFLTKKSEAIVAYRGDYRWVETFERVRLEPGEGLLSRLKNKGVYLITGGLGGIGLALAEFLATRFQARLILAGRSAFPPEAQWTDWLATHDHNDAISERIKKIKFLKNAGAEVQVVEADVADCDQMRKVISEAERVFGNINGVIHAAGSIDYGGLILRRAKEVTDIILSAKVKGTVVLDKLFAGKKLDFLLLCSSISDVDSGGMYGQVGYAAANEFLDAFTFYKRGLNDGYTVTINWDTWREVGMAARADRGRSNSRAVTTAQTSRDGLTPLEGAEVFNLVLNHNFPRLAVSVTELATRRKTSQTRTQRLPPENPVAEEAPMPGAKRPELDTTYIAASNELEKSLVNIWKSLLGFEEIGIDDNFFDLGGDSLLLMQLQLKIQQSLGTDLSSAEMFQHPTIGSLTKRLSQKPTEESGGLEAIHDRAQMQRAAMTRGFQRRNPVATE